MSCESKRDRLRDSSSLRHGQNPLSTRAARNSRIPASVNGVIGSSAHGSATGDRGPDPVARYDGLTFGELLDRPDALIVDCETTGLGPRAEIVELAAVDTTGVLRFAAPVMPQSRISSDASDIHGLTRVRLRELEAKPWPEHHAEVHALLDGRLVIGWGIIRLTSHSLVFLADATLRIRRLYGGEDGAGNALRSRV